MKDPSKESLLNQAQSLAKRRDQNYILRNDFKKETGVSDHYILKYWDSWSEFFLEAGLQPKNRKPLTNEQLFQAAFEVLSAEESIPTFTRFGKLIPYSKAVYKKRFGTWLAILNSLKEWLYEKEPTNPLVVKLEEYVEPKTSTQTNREPLPSKSSQRLHSLGGRRFGTFLNFRGLQHAPINEQGVVFLFGMVAFELGYVVESVSTGFPDCEAKRRIKSQSEAWERVRIEFEYQSKNFIDHGHDPEQCDIIVCWEHDWPECPIEVLDLSVAIKNLDNKG
jgi:hypothetical protein